MRWSNAPATHPTRRSILKGAALVLASPAVAWEHALAQDQTRQPELTIALFTDPHYADKPASGERHYRASLPKIEEAIERLGQAGPDFAVELGDFIDGSPSRSEEISALQAIEDCYAGLNCPRHYVLGNHDLHHLSKDDFIERTAAHAPYYSFDQAGYHFVILDACYRQDGEPYHKGNYEWTDTYVPEKQLDWLRDDLRGTDRPTVVFTHQRLDLEPDHNFAIKNCDAIRQLLAEAGNVRAVFHGHAHQNEHQRLDGIDYCVLEAVVDGEELETNAFALLKLYADQSIRIEGFHTQASHHWQG